MHTLHEACILHTPVVDIDGVFPVLVAKVLGEDLHVSRQDNEVDRFLLKDCLLYTSPSPRDKRQSRMPSSA